MTEVFLSSEWVVTPCKVKLKQTMCDIWVQKGFSLNRPHESTDCLVTIRRRSVFTSAPVRSQAPEGLMDSGR